jgi:ribosome-binding factor A
MPSGIRLQRIADRIRQELSEMLIHEISDPRLQQIFVTDVRVDRELAYADIYVSAVEGVERSGEVLAGLKSASGFLRRALAGRVEVRTFPRLRFHWDPTPENADHIERLLSELKDKKSSRSKPEQEE